MGNESLAVYVNGEYVAKDQARTSIFDSGSSVAMRSSTRLRPGTATSSSSPRTSRAPRTVLARGPDPVPAPARGAARRDRRDGAAACATPTSRPS